MTIRTLTVMVSNYTETQHWDVWQTKIFVQDFDFMIIQVLLCNLYCFDPYDNFITSSFLQEFSFTLLGKRKLVKESSGSFRIFFQYTGLDVNETAW